MLFTSFALAATKYEYYNTGDDNYETLEDLDYIGQTFTPQTTHTIASVKLKVFRLGSPGTATIGIRATSNSLPIGGNLVSGTFDANAITTDPTGEWAEAILSPPLDVTGGLKYAIVPIHSNYNPNVDELYWCYDSSIPAYAYGEAVDWTGSAWEVMYPVSDCMFEEWGSIPLSPPTSATATITNTSITLSWTKGDGATETYIRKKVESAPVDRTDGTLVYDGTGETVTDTDISPNQHIYYRFWSSTPDNGGKVYSSNYTDVPVNYKSNKIIAGTILNSLLPIAIATVTAIGIVKNPKNAGQIIVVGVVIFVVAALLLGLI